MALLTITNNGTANSSIHEPHTLFRGILPAGITKQFSVSSLTLMHLETQLQELRSRVDSNNVAVFEVSVGQDRYTSNLETQAASADVTRWAGNRVAYGLSIGNPTTPSVVAARRVDVDTAGEIYVDGKFFQVTATNDVVPTAEIDVDGVALVGSLATAADRYAHAVYVNNSGVLELVFVYGVSAGTGLADALTEDQIAVAIGEYLGEVAAVYSFCRVADILFAESAGLVQTTTNVRAVPPSYT